LPVKEIPQLLAQIDSVKNSTVSPITAAVQKKQA